MEKVKFVINKMEDNEFKMTPSCCTVVDRKDHVQYLQFQRAIPDACT